jgi:hypothetical protein
MEHNLGNRLTQTAKLADGIAFQVKLDGENYDCLILNEALFRLAELREDNADPASTFKGFERTILGTARRLIHAQVRGKPIVLRANHFRLASV